RNRSSGSTHGSSRSPRGRTRSANAWRSCNGGRRPREPRSRTCTSASRPEPRQVRGARMFKSLRERLAGWTDKAEAETTPAAIGDAGREIKEDKLEEILYDLEIALLESDVAFPVAKEIVDRLAEDLRGKRITREVSLEQGVEAALRDAITKALSVPPLDFFGLIEKSPRPFVVMFVGVNGTGKTTTIAKLAYHIMKKGYTCVVAAADTFRAGAIQQLEKHHEAVGLDGIVLTKIDADAKGGAALSMAKTIGKPVVFVNLGQTYKDIRRFDAKWMVDRLLAEA